MGNAHPYISFVRRHTMFRSWKIQRNFSLHTNVVLLISMSVAKLLHAVISFAGEGLRNHGLRIVILERENLKGVLVLAKTSTMHGFPCRIFSLAKIDLEVILCRFNFGDTSNLSYI